METRCGPSLLLGVLVLMAAGGCAWNVDAARALRTAAGRTDLRTGPSDEHNRVTVLPPGIPLWAVDSKNGFYQVELSGLLHAWVHESQISALDHSVGRPSPCDTTNLLPRSGAGQPWRACTWPQRGPAVRQNWTTGPEWTSRAACDTSRSAPADQRPVTWAVERRRSPTDWSRSPSACFHQQRGWQVSFRRRADDADPHATKARARGKSRGRPRSRWPGPGASAPSGLKEKGRQSGHRAAARELLTTAARACAVAHLRHSVGPTAQQGAECWSGLAASENVAADFFLASTHPIGRGDRIGLFGTET